MATMIEQEHANRTLRLAVIRECAEALCSRCFDGLPVNEIGYHPGVGPCHAARLHALASRATPSEATP